MIADDELHDFYTDLLGTIDIISFGRKTYRLMESFWPITGRDPRSTKSMLRFADKYNSPPKIVFSKTLDRATRNNTTLVKGNAVEEVLKLKQRPGRNTLAGGLNSALQSIKQGLINEYWFLSNPLFQGRKLFDDLADRQRIRRKLLQMPNLSLRIQKPFKCISSNFILSHSAS